MASDGGQQIRWNSASRSRDADTFGACLAELLWRFAGLDFEDGRLFTERRAVPTPTAGFLSNRSKVGETSAPKGIGTRRILAPHERAEQARIARGTDLRGVKNYCRGSSFTG